MVSRLFMSAEFEEQSLAGNDGRDEAKIFRFLEQFGPKENHSSTLTSTLTIKEVKKESVFLNGLCSK